MLNVLYNLIFLHECFGINMQSFKGDSIECEIQDKFH